MPPIERTQRYDYNLSAHTTYLMADSDQATDEALRVAKRYLAYGPRSAQDVHSRLKSAGFPEHVARQIVGRLSNSGVLNDEAYAMEYVKARFRHKSYGPQRLRAELHRHGIAEPLIRQALAQIAPNAVNRRAFVLAKQFWPRTQGIFTIRRRKVRDYLLRRGYSLDQAMAAIRQLSNEPS